MKVQQSLLEIQAIKNGRGLREIEREKREIQVGL